MGLRRGAHKLRVYDGDTRLQDATPTRLDIDAVTVKEWQQLGFYPVLPKNAKDAKDSMFYKLLHLKRKSHLM